MISSHDDKFHNFQILFVFFKKIKTIQPHVRGHVSWTRCLKFLFISQVSPQTGTNIMNIIFLHIMFYYLNNLRLKFDLIQKIASNVIN